MFNIVMGDTKVKKVTDLNSLGFVINYQLEWKDKIKNLVEKSQFIPVT